ncbi:SoxR reducing system RseC family protein [Halovibrio variabilis]|nr:SoxR reducing system RseC family protein [Halovibrio variabilis]
MASSCPSLQRTGTVADYTQHGLVVEMRAQERCEQCAQGRGCGVGLLSPQRSHRVAVALTEKSQHAYPLGSHVTVSLPRASLTLLAFFVYALPLLMALLLSGLASFMNAGTWIAPLIFFSTLGGGVISVKYLLCGRRERFRPRLVN